MPLPLRIGGVPRFWWSVRSLICGVTLTAVVLAGCADARAQDSEEVKKLKAVADTGDYAAAHQLATMYAVGDGVTLDKEAANHWYSVAASRRVQKPTDQGTKEAPATNASQSVVQTKGFYTSRSGDLRLFPNLSSVSTSRNQNPFSLDAMPSSRQPATEASAWKKAQDFVSEHTDEITDLATFLLEKYVPGLEPTEATAKKSVEPVHPSK